MAVLRSPFISAEPLKARLAKAARKVDLDRLPDVNDLKRDWERER
jgi:hypothetical protein